MSGHYTTLKKSLLTVTQSNRPLRYFSMKKNVLHALIHIHCHKQTNGGQGIENRRAEGQPPDQ